MSGKSRTTGPDAPDSAPKRGAAETNTPSFFDVAAVPEPATITAKARPASGTRRGTTDHDKDTADDGHDLSGHRSRLRQRFRKGGPDALPDYELLELILFRAIPRRDTKALAKRLIARFGSFAEVISAPEPLLTDVDGVGDSVVTELKLVRAAALRLLRVDLDRKQVLSSVAAVIDYCRAAQGFDAVEQFRVLFFDKRNQLIADEIQGKGTVDHTPVYVREVVKRALELSATAIILVHNHPSGDPTPSRADIDMTKMIVDAARGLGISVHDHIIVSRQGHASLKSLRLM